MSENLTFNQVNQQESSAYMKGLKWRDAMPSVLVGYDDGIAVGKLEKSTGNVYFTDKGMDLMYPGVHTEYLSDQNQERLAEALAGTALRGADAGIAPNTGRQERGESDGIAAQIAKIESAMDQLRDSLPESEQVPAWQFAVALHEYETVSATEKLSPQGLASAEQYRALYQQLKKLREQQPKV